MIDLFRTFSSWKGFSFLLFLFLFIFTFSAVSTRDFKYDQNLSIDPNHATSHRQKSEKSEIPLPTFDQIARSVSETDKVLSQDKLKGHDYGPFYNRFLAPFRISTQTLKIMEIGLGCGMNYGPGASVPLWLHSDLFPYAKIELHILEFDEVCGRKWKEENPTIPVTLHFGDQADFEVLNNVVQASGRFDIIIDDGGHQMHQQLNSLTFLFQHGLRHGGVYFLEDYVTSRIPDYNPNHQATTKAETLSWIDQLLSNHSPKISALSDLESIACGAEICAFFRRSLD